MNKDAANAVLLALVGSEGLVELWWTTPNRAFEGMKPNDVWELDYQKVLSYLAWQGYSGGGT